MFLCYMVYLLNKMATVSQTITKDRTNTLVWQVLTSALSREISTVVLKNGGWSPKSYLNYHKVSNLMYAQYLDSGWSSSLSSDFQFIHWSANLSKGYIYISFARNGIQHNVSKAVAPEKDGNRLIRSITTVHLVTNFSKAACVTLGL